MQRTTSSNGYLLCYMLNLFLNFWWGVIALLLWILHLLLGIPAFLSLIGLGVWLLVSLFATLLIIWGAKSSNSPLPQRENRNPYSAKNSDFFGKLKQYNASVELPNGNES